MSFVSSLNETPCVLTLAGQATPWRATLDEIARDSEITEIVVGVIKASGQVLPPVRRSLATQSVASLPFELPAAPESAAVTRDVVDPDEAALSVPGIAAAQLGAFIDLTHAGLNIIVNQPTVFKGHSQGVLGVEIARAWIVGGEARATSVFALARLIGVATARTTRRACTPYAGDATCMVSVRGVSDALLGRIIDSLPSTSYPLSIALRNDTDTHVVPGAPNDLASLVAAIERAAAKDKAAHDTHERGGRPLIPVCECLPVYAPFHSPMLIDALAFADERVAQCGIDAELAHSLGAAVLTTPVDWPSQICAAARSGATWIIDTGPGATTVRMTHALVEDTGVGVVLAGTASDRDKAATPGWAPEPGTNWSYLRPSLVTLPDGKTVVDAVFSCLTGRSPVLLAGMTPTTVGPEIATAAANAGFWAEMTGGGQVTEEVYNENLAGLRAQLRPGHAAEFNSIFLDRYLWNLQFGQARIVSRSRASGAPIDGVVISTGIPEQDEALALIAQLRADGLPYVAFRPGTVDQIRKVITIAREADPIKAIVQVEDGHSDGHHSWKDLPDLLLVAYAQLHVQSNIVLTVGGGIGIPERTADLLTDD